MIRRLTGNLHGKPCPERFSASPRRAGNEAIAKSKSEKPDLIPHDVVMPGTNGFQADARHYAREDNKHIPLIVVTSRIRKPIGVWGMRQARRTTGQADRPQGTDGEDAAIK